MRHRRLSEAAEKYFVVKEELERKERKRTKMKGRDDESEKRKKARGESTKKKIDYDHDCDRGKTNGMVVPREKGGGKAKSGSVGWISGGSKGTDNRKKELTRADFLVGLNAGPGAEATTNIIDAHARAVAVGVKRE